MQLIVLGMHRSGTSVLARMLSLMGVYFGPEGASTGANAENPKGFWERRDVRNLNDLLLQSAGCDWNRPLNFTAAAVPKDVIDQFYRDGGRIVLDMDAHRPWFLKEPRLCLLMPIWRRLLEVPVCIHVLRNPVEVASSLRTRNKISMEVGLAMWEVYVRSAAAHTVDLPSVFVSHRRMMDSPAEELASLRAQLEKVGVHLPRQPSPREIDAFVRRDLYREKEGREDLKEWARAPQVKMFMKALRSPAGFKALATGALGPDSRAALDAYEKSLPPVVRKQSEAKKIEQMETELRKSLAEKALEVERAVNDVAQKGQKMSQWRSDVAAIAAVWEKAAIGLAAQFAEKERVLSDLRALALESESGRAESQALTREAQQLRVDAAVRAREVELVNVRLRELEAALRSAEERLDAERILVSELREALAEANASRRELAVVHERVLADAARHEARTGALEQQATQWAARIAQLEADAKRGAEQATTHEAIIASLQRDADAVVAALDDAFPAAGIADVAAGTAADKVDQLVSTMLRRGDERRANEILLLDSVRAFLVDTGEEATVAGFDIACKDASARMAALLGDCALRQNKRLAELVDRAVLMEKAAADSAAELVKRTEELEASRAERCAYGAESARKDAEIVALTKMLVASEDAERGRFAEEKARAMAIAGKLRAQLERTETTLRDTQHSLSVVDAERIAAVNKVAAMSGSWTWRAAKPIRALARLVISGHLRAPEPWGDERAVVAASPLFDANWYVARYPDVAASKMDPVEHFVRHGASEARNPGPLFDTRAYLDHYADVAVSGMNPLVHYVRYGTAEGREAFAVREPATMGASTR